MMGNLGETKNEYTILRIEGAVGTIVLNHPEAMNALDSKMFDELQECTEELLNNEDIGAIILTGSGKAFCAGGDLKRMSSGVEPMEGYAYMSGFHPWVRRFIGAQKPTIAAVNGYALGAGFSVALLSDLIVASDRAQFGMAFANVGVIPDFAGLYTLTRAVGLPRAKELVYTAKNISAKQAMEWGIVNEVVEAERLLARAFELASQLANGPRVALKLAKKLLNTSADMHLEQLLEAESQAQALCFQTRDHKNAIRAFLNKEKPVFTGE